MEFEHPPTRSSHLSKIILEMTNETALAKVGANTQLPLVERGAAIVFRSLIGDDGFSEMASEPGVVVSNVESGHSWFVQALALAIANYGDPCDESHRNFFSGVLDAARGDLNLRSQLDFALAAWRERPLASLRRSGLVTSWLSGEA
jgi:hypothetical protein